MKLRLNKSYRMPGLSLPMMLSILDLDRSLVLIKLKNLKRGPVIIVGFVLFRKADMASRTTTSGG